MIEKALDLLKRWKATYTKRAAYMVGLSLSHVEIIDEINSDLDKVTSLIYRLKSLSGDLEATNATVFYFLNKVFIPILRKLKARRELLESHHMQNHRPHVRAITQGQGFITDALTLIGELNQVGDGKTPFIVIDSSDQELPPPQLITKAFDATAFTARFPIIDDVGPSMSQDDAGQSASEDEETSPQAAPSARTPSPTPPPNP